MRGAPPGYPALLQPVAHSLLQSLEEVRRHLVDLTPEQLAALKAEADPDLEAGAGDRLLAGFERAIDRALEQVRNTPESALTEPRGVGRAQLPSTVIGLLVHAAEHTLRHVGQMITTIRITRSSPPRL